MRGSLDQPMRMAERPDSRARTATVLLAGVAYVIAGAGTATLSRVASSPASARSWRLAAWLLSLAIFVTHFIIERKRRSQPSSVAARVAIAVAIGAFGVAMLGPVRAHWGEAGRLKLTLLSIVAWPVITGVPAFVVALIGGLALDRLRR